MKEVLSIILQSTLTLKQLSSILNKTETDTKRLISEDIVLTLAFNYRTPGKKLPVIKTDIETLVIMVTSNCLSRQLTEYQVAAMCGITREELLDIASTETFKWFMKKRMKEIVALNITNVIYSIIESSNNPRNSGDRAILVSMIDALAGDEDSEHVGDDLYYTVEDDER